MCKTLVYIEWIDASYQRGECTDEELRQFVKLQTAGLLVAEGKEFISVALDRYAEDKFWRYIEHIPKVNIKKIKKFKI